MTTQATPDMAAYCFDVLIAALTRQPSPRCPSSIPDVPTPIFVTWSTLTSPDVHDTASTELRGCIGNFDAQPLRQQLREFALVAALEDTRFAPIALHEVPRLACSVSLLHSFEPCAGWDDWRIGEHGIRIRYGRYGATFLPSVAPEQGWDHTQTLRALLAKAGYRGSIDAAVLRAVSVTRYQVSCSTVAYSETQHAKRDLSATTKKTSLSAVGAS